MKLQALAALVLCAALTPVLSAEPARSPTEALASLDPLFEKFMREQHIPGLVYGVVVDGRLARVQAFGVREVASGAPVTPDTVFRIASMSKQLTALATLRLRDAGQLSLDTPAEKYIPEMRRWKYPTGDSPKITVRDLLSHSAGFVTDDPWGDRQLDMTEPAFTRFVFEGVPFSHAPETAYEYSNFGFALVGRLVGNVSKSNYSIYIAENFFKPLGMRHTGWDIGAVPAAQRAIGYRWEKDAWLEEPALGPGAFGAMGGMITTANDYSRYVAWVLAAWPPRDAAEDVILRRSSVREIARPANYMAVVAPADTAGCARAVSYGFGMGSYSDCTLGFHFGHSGGLPGYGSNVLYMPQRGVAVFAFNNRTYGPVSRAVREAANLLVSSGQFPVRPAELSPLLQSMLQTSQIIYDSADVARFPEKLAVNFLLDRSAAMRNAELAALKAQYGACHVTPPLTSDSALSGSFDFDCERGKLRIEVILAPTPGGQFQKLEFVPVSSRTGS